jgi:hypothetical protein
MLQIQAILVEWLGPHGGFFAILAAGWVMGLFTAMLWRVDP